MYDNFFELGGHSLNAASIILKVNQEFDVNIHLSEMFKKPTIKEFTTLILDGEQHKSSIILPVEAREYYPVSSQQKRLFIMWQLNRDSVAYNLPSGTIIEGDLEYDMLVRAFNILLIVMNLYVHRFHSSMDKWCSMYILN